MTSPAALLRRVCCIAILCCGCGSTPGTEVELDAEVDGQDDAARADVMERRDARDDVAEPFERTDTATRPDVARPEVTPDAATDAEADTATEPGPDVLENPCAPPHRMWPTTGPTTGGTRVHVVGEAWYIGALGWFLDLGDQTIAPLWGDRLPATCQLTFVTQPSDPGSVPATIYYGEPSGPWEEIEPFGSFTFVPPMESTVGESCASDEDCRESGEERGPHERRCDAGLGGCVVDRCVSATCGGAWLGGPCDSLRGCVDAPECETDDDCRLIFSSCGCMGVPDSDPRETLDACLYEGCQVCGENACADGAVRAVCVAGVCGEQ